MARFSRQTILVATDTLPEFFTASGIERFLLEYGLEGSIGGGSKESRGIALAKFLLKDPEGATENGDNLAGAIVSALAQKAIEKSTTFGEFRFEDFTQEFTQLHRAFERDGFTVEGGMLRPTLPLDLPRADDEVHRLLDKYGFSDSKTHLDQGITAHARGDWAAANGQLRTFIESLFDSIAEHFANGASLPQTGDPRRQWLAKGKNPPFFQADLNEWTGKGTGFIEGFFRRLHPHGAHPGPSNEEDSTFRLHLVLLVAHNLLKRIQSNQSVPPSSEITAHE